MDPDDSPGYANHSGFYRQHSRMKGMIRTISETPRLAPPDFAIMEPCEDISAQQAGIPFPRYAGSGVPVEAHPFQPRELFSGFDGTCAACGSGNTLCIYLFYTADVGTGRDLEVELFCPECGRFTVVSCSR